MTRLNKIFVEITVALLVFLFLYTAISKFIDFEGFKSSINSQPFPDVLTPFLAWTLPLVELGAVVLLLFEKTRLSGLYVSLVLMGLFTIYTALVLMHVFAHVPCSCGGVIRQLSWRQHLIFNLFFVAISFIAIKLTRQKHLQSISG